MAVKYRFVSVRVMTVPNIMTVPNVIVDTLNVTEYYWSEELREGQVDIAFLGNRQNQTYVPMNLVSHNDQYYHLPKY